MICGKTLLTHDLQVRANGSLGVPRGSRTTGLTRGGLSLLAFCTANTEQSKRAQIPIAIWTPSLTQMKQSNAHM